jgi:hypothetical protein
LQEKGVRLEYLGGTSIMVRGPSTGRPYYFSAAEQLQPVDRRDVDALRRTQLFR